MLRDPWPSPMPKAYSFLRKTAFVILSALNAPCTTNGPPSWLTSPSGFSSLVPSSKKPSSFSNGVIAPIAGFVFFIVLGLPLRWLRLKEYYLFKITHLGTGRPESKIQVGWLPNQSPLCSSYLARYCSSNLLIHWEKNGGCCGAMSSID